MLFLLFSPVQSVILLQKWSIFCFLGPPISFLFLGHRMSNLLCLSPVLDSYMTRAGFPLVSLLLLSGHNRARQRDKWAVVLEELSTLQEESEKLDQFLQTQWIKHVPGMPLYLEC